MTNQEALIALLQVSGYPDSAIELALANASIDGTLTYESTKASLLAAAAIEVLYGMAGVQEIKEGGYQITYSIAGVKARIAYLSNKYALSNPLSPQIRNKSFMW